MRVGGIAVLALPWMLISASAVAGDADAEELFRSAQQLLRDGRIDDACAAFQKSYDIDHNVQTLANVGDCEEKGGHVASAWKAFIALGEATKGDKAQKALNKVANDRARKLESRVSFLTVTVPDEVAALPGLTIRLDGEPLSGTFWNTPVAVDGGDHTLAATATGYRDGAQSVTVAGEADHAALTIAMLDPVPTDTGAAVTPTPTVDAGAPAPVRARGPLGSGWYAGIRGGLEGLVNDPHVSAYAVGAEGGRHQSLGGRLYARGAAILEGEQIDEGRASKTGVAFALEGGIGVTFLRGSLLVDVTLLLGYSSGGNVDSAGFATAGGIVAISPEIAYVHRGRYELALACDAYHAPAGPNFILTARYHL